jgi:hypothetical protein
VPDPPFRFPVCFSLINRSLFTRDNLPILPTHGVAAPAPFCLLLRSVDATPCRSGFQYAAAAQDIVVGSRGCSEVLTAVKLWLLCVERNDGRGGEMEGSGLRSD